MNISRSHSPRLKRPRQILTGFLILAGAGVFFSAAAHSALHGEHWPMQRGTEKGHARCIVPEDTAVSALREWHFTSKQNRRYKQGLAVWASPAVAVVNGTPMAFIGGSDYKMHALDLARKKRRWFKITNGEIADAPAVGRMGDTQVVVWGSADRYVYAHQAESGRPLWTHELFSPSPSQAPAEVSAPLIHNRTVYISAFVYDKALSRNKQKGWLYALDLATGNRKWRQQISSGPLSAPVGTDIDGRFHVFTAAQRGLLQAFDVSDGSARRRWSFQMPHEVLAAPAIETNREEPLIFLGSKFGNLIAIDARSGEAEWRTMTGNWVDNNAAVAEIDGENVVFVGSHDYCVYALRARDGYRLWRQRLGGEVYSAPAMLELDGEPAVAVASLDNHLYVLNARTGRVETSFFTGQPVWDKITKGETLWGSPVSLQTSRGPTLIHGSYNGYVYTLPLTGEVSLRAKVQSATKLWEGLAVVLGVFVLVILPVALKWPSRKGPCAET